MRGKALGLDFREGLCSAKGNRTAIARMKILSTNRYTMAPNDLQFDMYNARCNRVCVKSGCKSTAFFLNTQIFLHFFIKKIEKTCVCDFFFVLLSPNSVCAHMDAPAHE